MNHRFLFLLALFASAAFTSCSDASGHAVRVEKLLKQSEAVSKELEAIDPAEAEALYSTSTDVKKQFKTAVQNDTLDLVFAEKLDRYLKANRDLKGLAEERESCLAANAASRKRLAALKKDIAEGSGDRARYAEFVRSETAEMSEIREHCTNLVRRFRESKTAIEQFQPEIERFISQFVMP